MASKRRPPTEAGWLVRRGFVDVERTRRFLQPRLAELSSPDAMVDRETVARRLAQAVRARERIAVFGDYDCDGITSAAILTEVLRRVGADALPLIASRFDGGYGVSGAAVQRILSTGARLLVTCDCGSATTSTRGWLEPPVAALSLRKSRLIGAGATAPRGI